MAKKRSGGGLQLSDDAGPRWYDRDPITGRATLWAPMPWPSDGAFELSQAALSYIKKYANLYVRGLAEVLGIPPYWAADLDSDAAAPKRPVLRWVDPDAKGQGAAADPRRSFLMARNYRSTGETVGRDYTLVLMATLHWAIGKPPKVSYFPLHGGQGVRVLITFDPAPKGSSVGGLRCVAATNSLPPEAGVSASRWNNVLTDARVAAVLGEGAQGFHSMLLSAASLDPAQHDVADLGIRFLAATPQTPESLPMPEVVARTLPRPGYEQGVNAYAITASFDKKTAIARVTRERLFAHADSNALVYVQDPMTRFGKTVYREMRVNRKTQLLDRGRKAVKLRDVQQFGGNVDLDDKAFVTVVQSPVADAGSTFAKDKPKRVARAVNASVRTNTFAAVNAYYRVKELMARLDRYGLPPKSFFRAAALPLTVRYRAGIKPGPGKDGNSNTINAQVTWGLAPQRVAGAFVKGLLEMRFALGDLQINPGRRPLGIAADPRWCWHEFGHVLLAAATGELEFRFAHSPGDALAAIVNDPRSALSGEQHWRFVTFPWVSIPCRNHGRHAVDGWSWNGSLCRPERFYAGKNGRHELDRNGYWTEQILSSSLFRLYRALGGDTLQTDGNADKRARTRAAEYAVYLIVHGIALLGTASTAAAARPEDFASAMIAADLATTAFDNGPGVQRGHLAHKVVRWAFERQGLYADLTSGLPQNTAGRPPAVDVFIDDRRASGGGRGEYDPVDFVSDDWQAPPTSIWVRRNADNGLADESPTAGAVNHVYAHVFNRGQSVASQTTVTVWCAELTSASRPRWPSAKWKPLNPVVSAAQDVNPGGPALFGPFAWQPKAGKRYAILAAARCNDDRANTEPPPGVAAVSAQPTEDVARVVAWDNNLGLREIDVV